MGTHSRMEGDTVVLQDIFLYKAPPFVENGQNNEGRLEPTGIRTRFMPRLEAAGFRLSADVFGARRMDLGRR